jgi:hypothetical protein
MHHANRVITVFSASNYTGSVGNDGALLVFERDAGTTVGSSRDATRPPASPRMRPASPAMHGDHAAAASAAAAVSTPAVPARSTRHSTGKLHEIHLPLPAAHAASQDIVPLKRSIVTFYAKPKEKSASYRVNPESNLQTDVVSKLLHLISDKRLALIDFWSKQAVAHSSSVQTITRAVWARGLKTVLSLTAMPFEQSWFQELLGLPKLGVDGKANGPVDFLNFLNRFRPVNLLVMKAQRIKRSVSAFSSLASQSQEASLEMGDVDAQPEADADDDAAVASMERLLEFLHAQRFQLESLFRFLDQDGESRMFI